MSDACRLDIPRVVSAAINCGGAIFALPPPARHEHIIGHMLRQGVDADRLARGAPGFLVTDGRFVLRHLALRIARRAGQVAADADDRRGLRCEDVIYAAADRHVALADARLIPVTEPPPEEADAPEPDAAADMIALSSFEEARARLMARTARGESENEVLARMMRQTASEMLRRAEELVVLSAEIESGRVAHLLGAQAGAPRTLDAGE